MRVIKGIELEIDETACIALGLTILLDLDGLQIILALPVFGEYL